MKINSRHFRLDVTVGSSDPTATGTGISKIKARIAYDNTSGVATLWAREKVVFTNPILSVAIGLEVDKFLFYDSVAGAGRYEDAGKNAYGYTILKCHYGNVTISKREPIYAASGLETSNNLVLVGTVDLHELSLTESIVKGIASGHETARAIAGLTTERVFLSRTSFNPEDELTIKLPNSDECRITSITPDKNLYRITCVGV
jgi:hypothetical protein